MIFVGLHVLYSAKFSQAVNFVDFPNFDTIMKIIFMKIIALMICPAQNWN